MEHARRLLREAVGDHDGTKPGGADARGAGVDFDNLLRLRPTIQQPAKSSEPLRPTNQALPQDWPAALDLVKQAAEVVRQSEHRIQEQESRFQEIAQRVRAELKSAQERADAAESRAQAVERSAETRIKAAEARAQEAEARVRAAEARAKEAESRAESAQDWLSRIHDTIVNQLSEFPTARRARAN